jgi:uncharacterized membrane-anchored protein
MKRHHVPNIDGRYWTAITLASIFGTNLGDLYAHKSGLGLIGGLPILLLLFVAVYVTERFDKLSHDLYYWLCIIILRTGATNMADYLAGRRGLAIDRLSLSIGLGLALALLAWWAGRAERGRSEQTVRKSVPDTDARYWVAMCQREPKFPQLRESKIPHPVHASASSVRTRPAFNFSLSRYELPRTFSVTA